MIGRLANRLRGLAANHQGSVAAEFLAVSPVLLIMLFGVIDIGNVLFTRFRLNAAVAAGTNYSIVRSADIGTDAAGSLASSVAKVVANASDTSGVSATIAVNNGPTATVTGGGTVSTTTTNAATTNGLCYCPTTSSDWGVKKTCGDGCSGGGLAGRFVRITASKAYKPLFASYGIVRNGTITATNLVQTE